jgi:RimJ/RimL family protein N-acetyltransferase
MQVTPVILTGRYVRLEPITAAHAAPLALPGGDAELWQYTSYGRPDPQDGFRAWFERVTQQHERGTLLGFAIVDLMQNELVGGTTYLDISPADRRLEIGNTWIARSRWRTPVNTECKLLLLRHAFETLGANRVQLKTDARNLRSQRAIERLGAVKEGVLRKYQIMGDGFVRDTVMYSIIAAEWPAVKARLEGMLNR